jgi:KTSC domain
MGAGVKRRRVQSSVIRSVGYDAASSILEVEFVASGDVYAYYDLPLSVYDELLSAESMGAYFNEYIKDLYACQQVR